MKKIVWKKVNITLIVLLFSIIILNNNTNLFIKKANKTGVLSRNYFTVANLSPDKKRLLLDMGDNIGIFDIKREVIIHSIPKKTDQYNIYHFEWTWDNRILVIKDDHVKRLDSYLVTDNLLDYENRFNINERSIEYPLNNYRRWFVQDKATKKIFIEMENAEVWNTNLSTEYFSKKPSMDDNFRQMGSR